MLKTALNLRYKIKTSDGFKPFGGIRVFKSETISVTLSNDVEIRVTPTHRFIVNENYIVANNLVIGDLLEYNGELLPVISIKDGGEHTVYDIIHVENGEYQSNNIRSKNCSFVGSSRSLVSAELLTTLQPTPAIDIRYNGDLNIYKLPVRGKSYIACVDPAEGTGNDYSVIHILEYTSDVEVEQVATYRENKQKPENLARAIIAVSKFYNEAPIMIENNSIGNLIIRLIWDTFEYDNIITTDPKSQELGIRSTKKTKFQANMNMRNYVENVWVKIHDAQTLLELRHYDDVGNGIYKSSVASVHDDTVTALIWGLFYFKTMFYEGVVGSTTKVDDYSLDKDDDDDESGCVYATNNIYDDSDDWFN